ncbi:sphingolipid delta-4 desaturase [Blastocladiella emersonii ATCC 22665]|nr:sphingolipid delta-4 desaturase [Blastocladiella emersonii ATCC 22665]
MSAVFSSDLNADLWDVYMFANLVVIQLSTSVCAALAWLPVAALQSRLTRDYSIRLMMEHDSVHRFLSAMVFAQSSNRQPAMTTLPNPPLPDTLARTLRMQETGKTDEGVALSDSSDTPIYDVRHPTYLGEWEKSVPYVHDGIAQDDLDEPHRKRAMYLLDKHPDVKELAGPEWKTKYITVATVSIQLALAYAFGAPDGYFRDAGWFPFLVCAYFVGGSITALFGVLIHECAHNLAFKANFPNRILGLIANVGLIVPIASSFRRYHLIHHAYQGVEGVDPDLPLGIELKLVRGNKFLKALWVFCFPVLYVARGAAMLKPPQKWEIINWIWTISTDLAVYHFCGGRGFFYLFLSLWFGYGLHPGAAHFIQEHYSFEDGQETYSYYGSGNIPYLNIGFHNEHHDHMSIPWSRLPLLRARAPEIYDTIPYHTSWCKVIYDFIMRDDIGPQSRVGRSEEAHKAGRATIAAARKLKRE